MRPTWEDDMRRWLPPTLCLTAVVAAAPYGFAQTPSGKPVHRFQRVAEGVYSAVATGAMTVGSNSAVIVNQKDVMIVDSHITPASARALIEEIKTLTDKPVRYVVNTHFHFDHAHGNQVFPDDVLIIGHEFTREKLIGDPLNERSYKSFTGALPAQVEALKKQIAEQADAAEKAKLEDRLAVLQAYTTALAEVKPTPPNLTLKARMTLHRGPREIQLLFFGRGHTGGDVVVYLPREKVVCTGDLLTAGLAYLGDGFVDEWVATLDALKGLDFETVIPGHGEPFTGKAKIDQFQAYLRDVWSQVTALKKQGVPAEEAAKRVDMTAHQAAFPQIQGPGVDARAVVRMYEVMDGKDRR
jgi:glyoxylase-like metal-dependent hydrolase (beta-lactamase superfamily II)